MNGERVGDIVLHGNDAIRFAYMLYHPTEEELLYNRSVLERIDNNITITERDNGYDAEIKDLDLNFLEEKPQCSLDNIDGLQHMNELIDELQKKGAEIVLYENDRVVETEFLKNILESHFDTERYLQETDDKVIEQD